MKTPSKFLAVGFLSLSLVLASGTAALASDPSDGFVSQAAKLSFENSTQDISGLNTPLPLDSDMAKKMAEALETINNVPGVSDDERSQITQELKTLKTKKMRQ